MANNPDGTQISNAILSDGVNFGSYATDSNAWINFEAVSSRQSNCGISIGTDAVRFSSPCCIAQSVTIGAEL